MRGSVDELVSDRDGFSVAIFSSLSPYQSLQLIMCSVPVFWDESLDPLTLYLLFLFPGRLLTPQDRMQLQPVGVPSSPSNNEHTASDPLAGKEPTLASSPVLSSSFVCFSVCVCL